jgi:hypothetical protein
MVVLKPANTLPNSVNRSATGNPVTILAREFNTGVGTQF